MDQAYGVGLLLDRMGWRPGRISDRTPFPGTTPRGNIEATLRFARRKGYDTVVYRQSDAAENRPNPTRPGFDWTADSLSSRRPAAVPPRPVNAPPVFTGNRTLIPLVTPPASGVSLDDGPPSP